MSEFMTRDCISPKKGDISQRQQPSCFTQLLVWGSSSVFHTLCKPQKRVFSVLRRAGREEGGRREGAFHSLAFCLHSQGGCSQKAEPR